jgi:hypothetical protein
MIPYEKYSDDPNYMQPGSGIPPAHEGLTECKGMCGIYLWSPGYCIKCGEEVEALRRMWNFEKHRRARRKPLEWTVILQLVVFVPLAAFVLWNLAAQIADWIAGGN